MKKLLFFAIILTACKTNQEEKNNLENSIWKFSNGTARFSDILVFSEEYLYVKNDSIYHHKDKIALGAVDKIEYYYGERRLIVLDLEGNKARYCEQ